MVNPVSSTEQSTARLITASAGPRLPSTSKAVLNVNLELQKQISRFIGNSHRLAQQARPNRTTAALTLHTVIRNRPETAVDLLRLLSSELAAENYGLAKLYRAFKTRNFNDLPTPDQLTDDLGNICAVDSMPDKTFVTESLDKLMSNFIEPARVTTEAGGAIPAQHLIRLANLSTVLLKALGGLSENSVTTIGNLSTDQLGQLIAGYDLAIQTAPPGEELQSIEATRNILDRKRNAILLIQEFPLELANLDEATRGDRDVVMTAVQMIGWTLSFASDALKNDREVVLAAVRQNGYVLGFADQSMRNDRPLVMAAVENNGAAFQFASEELKKDKALAIAAVRNSQVSVIFMSPQLQRDPEIRAIAFPRHEQH